MVLFLGVLFVSTAFSEFVGLVFLAVGCLSLSLSLFSLFSLSFVRDWIKLVIMKGVFSLEESFGTSQISEFS